MILYFIISLTNVFLHIVRSILVIKAGRFVASLSNCVCYTFSAIVIKFIAESDLMTAIQEFISGRKVQKKIIIKKIEKW